MSSTLILGILFCAMLLFILLTGDVYKQVKFFLPILFGASIFGFGTIIKLNHTDVAGITGDQIQLLGAVLILVPYLLWFFTKQTPLFSDWLKLAWVCLLSITMLLFVLETDVAAIIQPVTLGCFILLFGVSAYNMFSPKKI